MKIEFKNNFCQTFYKLNNNKQLEICLVLFKKCNLNCLFCFQNKNRFNDIDKEYILNIPDKILEPLKVIVNKRKYSEIIFRIWGGELFSDDLNSEMFLIYNQLKNKLKKLETILNIKIKIYFSSNLVFEKNKNNVKALISDDNVFLVTSFDPVYRFINKKQFEIWQKNIQEFKPVAISITLTKQNINKYCTDKSYLENLKNYNLAIEYYIYNNNYNFFKPTEDDLYNFFKYCIDNKYYNISEIKAIVQSFWNKNGRYCTCNNSCQYKNEKLLFNCVKRSSDLPINQFFNFEIDDGENYSEFQLRAAIEKKKCFLCKRFSYCRLYCMASILHYDYKPEECALNRIYDYIDENSIKCI